MTSHEYSWNITVGGRSYKIQFLTRQGADQNGLYINTVKEHQPIPKTFGLFRLNYDFTVNGEKVTLVMFGNQCDLIVDGMFVKYKSPVRKKLIDTTVLIGFLLSLASFGILAVFGVSSKSVLLSVGGVLCNMILSISPFTSGWKKLLINLACLALTWGASFLLL